jgi:hypothetical protein
MTREATQTAHTQQRQHLQQRRQSATNHGVIMPNGRGEAQNPSRRSVMQLTDTILIS